MNLGDGIILGAVQGITEFLPISSSGHLILFREMMGLNVGYGISFDAVLQLATSLAILACFKDEFIGLIKAMFSYKKSDEKNKKLLVAIIVGTIPAIFFGLLLEEYMGTIFRNSMLVGWTLIIGSVLFLIAERFSKENGVPINSKELCQRSGCKKGLGIGFFQALAIFPGMSRSGSALAGGMLFGLSREEATRFSFMLGFPILFGSGIKKLFDLGVEGAFSDIGFVLLISALVAFIVGFSAMKFMLKYLKDNKLYAFAVYRVIVAVIIFFVLLN